MTIFSSLDAAVRAGFQWLDWCEELQLHIVVIDRLTARGRVRSLAFARPQANETHR